MANISNLATSFIIFAVLASLYVTIYDGIEDSYNITKSDTMTFDVGGTNQTGNIADQFKALYLIEGVSEAQVGVSQLKAPSNIIDILGGLVTAGIGALKTIAGIIVFPYQITNIVLTYYVGEIPGILGGLVMMAIVYVGMIMLAVFLRRDRI